MAVGILAYGGYVPHHRLSLVAISSALGGAGGRGSRSVAGYDEDTTTLAVEAARIAARRVDRNTINAVYFATATPAYLDKTNATAIHAALRLDSGALGVDMLGSARSAAGVWRSAIDAATAGRSTLAVFSDIRTGLPGSADERDGGDAGAAFVLGEGPSVIAEVVGFASTTEEFLDRWRLPSEDSSHVWEERFGETVYGPLGESAVADACKSAGISPHELNHAVVAGLHSRAVRNLPKALGVVDVLAPDLTDVIGNSGTAHAALVLADVLDRALSDQYILVLNLADGADAIVLRTTEALAAYQVGTAIEHSARTVRAQLDRGNFDLPYAMFLTWRGHLHREPPRREDPDRPMAPPATRRAAWKFAFVGTRCRVCGKPNLPPQRVCYHCQAVDQMDAEEFADVRGTVSTFTVDRLAYSLSPPVVAAIIDFDGGGRYQSELTDVAPDDVGIGTRVEMTFRRMYTAGGIHDYFWKARPAAT
jgi:hydroxymethylglutaryl-CoA synthase